jgi:hypothetical protein
MWHGLLGAVAFRRSGWEEIVPRNPDTCPRCGLINPPGQRRCDTCGAPMDAPPVWAQRHPDLAHLGRGLHAIGSYLLDRLIWKAIVLAILMAAIGAWALYQRILGQ